ncbi:uncharacterized protein TrAFT101_003242 [Trichoderma asperellum]|uniref:uncharacterized protein n=1 Tax=Trichoderma asperellum TaxID=101201 RepID=UPI00331BCB2D|nr:hypothetical protein TrAFT101_003242 [Trichoderma asperellum]
MRATGEKDRRRIFIMRREFKRKGKKKRESRRREIRESEYALAFFYFNFICFFFFCFCFLFFCFFLIFFFFRNCKRRGGMGKIWEEGEEIKKSLEDGLCVSFPCTYVWLCV